MATSLDTLSLSQMLDLAIGTPQKGAIHFAAMRKLLQAMLEHLDVQYLTSEEPWPGQLSGPSLADVTSEVKVFKKEMEKYKKHMSKVKALASPLGTPQQTPLPASSGSSACLCPHCPGRAAGRGSVLSGWPSVLWH